MSLLGSEGVRLMALMQEKIAQVALCAGVTAEVAERIVSEFVRSVERPSTRPIQSYSVIEICEWASSPRKEVK